MIHIIKSYDECRDFIPGFREDPNFSDPMLTSEEQVQCNLIQAIGRPDRCVLRVDRDGRMIGLFAFLILREEQYLEMLLVDVDNVPAIRLYESLGFKKVQNQNNLTAHWTVPCQSKIG